MLRTHSAGEMRKEHVGSEVTLAGWVDRRRDHGGLIFIDLRDRSGIIQVVYNPEVSPECHEIGSEMRSEFVISVTGQVALRPDGTENPRLPTGYVEIIAASTKILSRAETPPFYINKESDVEENVRLRYRYLDLRRPHMQQNLILRHRMVKFIRDFLDERGFLEIETPILINSTPEGARDYLVPSRVQPGKFYALPQSPQQLKQLLMVAGFEKYFQIARCFRDEDLRADRQPEFTQLDLEMSFIEEEDVIQLMEGLLINLVETLKPEKRLIKPFPRLTYQEAMQTYGTDKPDMRFGLELTYISDIATRTDFAVFHNALVEGGRVKGIYAPGGATYTRKQLDELRQIAIAQGAQGLVTISLGASGIELDDLSMDMIKSAAAKYLSLDTVKEMARHMGAKPGDLLMVVADKANVVNTTLGVLRLEIGRRLNLIDPDLLAFAFVTDFPLLAKDDKTGRWMSVHHPFTAPREEDAHLLGNAPELVMGRHYDLVANGYEIAGGSIRIHSAEMQRKMFRLLGYRDQEIEERFGHLLEAFDYGAPPHGGIAAGIDRLAMLLTGEESIREVIAFPKTQSAADLTLDAPSTIDEEQLAELHIRLRSEDIE